MGKTRTICEITIFEGRELVLAQVMARSASKACEARGGPFLERSSEAADDRVVEAPRSRFREDGLDDIEERGGERQDALDCLVHVEPELSGELRPLLRADVPLCQRDVRHREV